MHLFLKWANWEVVLMFINPQQFPASQKRGEKWQFFPTPVKAQIMYLLPICIYPLTLDLIYEEGFTVGSKNLEIINWTLLYHASSMNEKRKNVMTISLVTMIQAGLKLWNFGNRNWLLWKAMQWANLKKKKKDVTVMWIRIASVKPIVDLLIFLLWGRSNYI